MNARIIRGTAERFCSHYRGEKFHALLCDPPYHLSEVKTPLQSFRSQFAGRTEEQKRARTGFMGKKWDGGDIAYQPETWAALSTLLHPGAFGMAFASSRGWHRLAVAIEDAGLRIHPSIFGWVYATGFPKATRVKDAPAFEGHRYGLQALKPALEPIIVFQKPYEGRPVDSITATGAGALNIDGGRVATDDTLTGSGSPPLSFGGDNSRPFHEKAIPRGVNQHEQGRWPANFYTDDDTAPLLDEMSGELQSGYSSPGAKRKASKGKGGYHDNFPDSYTEGGTYGDIGGASRFFTRIALHEADVVRYVPKASRDERERGLIGGLPCVVCGGLNTETHTDERGKQVKCRRNPHPTVKSIALTKWLATLLLPPYEYAPRRLLVPFAGTGSEMIGAYRAGWDCIIGVEMEHDTVQLARARIAHWTNQPIQLAFEATQ